MPLPLENIGLSYKNLVEMNTRDGKCVVSVRDNYGSRCNIIDYCFRNAFTLTTYLNLSHVMKVQTLFISPFHNSSSQKLVNKKFKRSTEGLSKNSNNCSNPHPQGEESVRNEAFTNQGFRVLYDRRETEASRRDDGQCISRKL